MREIDQTQAAYRRIAAVYADTTVERGQILHDLEAFMKRVPAHSRVLDVGCGPGFDTAILRERQRQAVGVDLSWHMMQSGRQRGVDVPCAQADMCLLPIAAGAVDAVWACASLLHLPRPLLPSAFAEFCRILRPGGIFYMSVKLGDGEQWSEQSYKQQAPRFFVYWQPETIDPLLAAAGFTITDGWQNAGQYGPWLARLSYKH
ncbi:MAG: class I SAM-dependent methyltransferase [Anaerolineales bacterium]|nr:class I SAM-dependent methyltransferase [Anaerolineales bacterium]